MQRIFVISFSADIPLTLDQLWPDGDAPEDPTVQDVEELIRKDGGAISIIDKWDLRYQIADSCRVN